MKKLTEQQKKELLKTEYRLINIADIILAFLLSIGAILIFYSIFFSTDALGNEFFNVIAFSTGTLFCFIGYLSKLLISILSEISTTLKIQTFGKED
ncbi:hypothetical protein [Chishuiella sp.]|uniref:hypothetical protein n=1 Tax=Chishuiella sp. TaxID=1969467 RepID=UPI0028B25A70|nr:hypothetical protein [Chishuiella sp.]